MTVAELMGMLMEQREDAEIYVDIIGGRFPNRSITHVMDDGLGKVAILAPAPKKGSEENV